MGVTSNIRQVQAEIDRMAAELLKDVQGAIDAEMAQSMERVALATPRSQGPGPHMADEYRLEQPGPGMWDIANLADYAGAVAFGRRAVTIVPKARQWLRWPDASLPGGYAFAREVHQPARGPNVALSAAIDEEEAHLSAALDEALARVVASFP